MQTKKAGELSEKWGNKPCDHPSLDKEYHLGSATGDYVCTKCGKTDWGRDWGRDWEEKNATTTKNKP